VFAIDLSLSMAMRSNLVPAKKMVLALTSLIRSKFPRDFVAVVGFGETAQELKIEDVPALTIDYATAPISSTPWPQSSPHAQRTR